MVAGENIKIEMSACNGWRSNPLTTHYGRINDTLANPVIVPCYNGKSLQIREELVLNGLSAISIKHDKGNCMLSEGEDELREGKRKFSPKKNGLPVCLGERMKRRNSFWNMHRPELSKLTWPKNYISSDMLQDFFHNHLQTHGTFCEPLHFKRTVPSGGLRDYTILREFVPSSNISADEKGASTVEKSRSVQLNDENLNPEIKISKLSLKKSSARFQPGNSPSKQSEEVISSVTSNTTEVDVEDSGDPARLRTILSPREEGETEKLRGK